MDKRARGRHLKGKRIDTRTIIVDGAIVEIDIYIRKERESFATSVTTDFVAVCEAHDITGSGDNPDRAIEALTDAISEAISITWTSMIKVEMRTVGGFKIERSQEHPHHFCSGFAEIKFTATECEFGVRKSGEPVHREARFIRGGVPDWGSTHKGHPQSKSGGFDHFYHGANSPTHGHTVYVLGSVENRHALTKIASAITEAGRMLVDLVQPEHVVTALQRVSDGPDVLALTSGS